MNTFVERYEDVSPSGSDTCQTSTAHVTAIRVKTWKPLELVQVTVQVTVQDPSHFLHDTLLGEAIDLSSSSVWETPLNVPCTCCDIVCQAWATNEKL